MNSPSFAVKRRWVFAFLFMLLHPVVSEAAKVPACPDGQGFRSLATAEHLYLGELHGTEEVPALVQCLVKAALDRGARSLVVSLELPNPDRPEGKNYWRTNRDGKSSRAMWRLFRWLRVQETEGRLSIHYQYDNSPWAGQAAYEQRVGEELKALIASGHPLIAYGGNFHSRRDILSETPEIVPTGAIVGPAILHVDVAAAHGGQAWNCRRSAAPKVVCAAHEIPPFPAFGAQPGELIDGATAGHDRIYLFGRFTASAPQFH